MIFDTFKKCCNEFILYCYYFFISFYLCILFAFIGFGIHYEPTVKVLKLSFRICYHHLPDMSKEDLCAALAGRFPDSFVADDLGAST